MKTLLTLTLGLFAILALGRALYYQVVVMRRMAWPYEGENTASTALPPPGTTMERIQFFMRDSSHRQLRRTWAASWIWALIFFFIFLVWIIV